MRRVLAVHGGNQALSVGTVGVCGGTGSGLQWRSAERSGLVAGSLVGIVA